MSKSTYKEWTSMYQTARDDLRKAQRRFQQFKTSSDLVRDARVDVIDDLRSRLVEEYQRSKEVSNGTTRGLAKSIEILDAFRKEVNVKEPEV